MDQTNVGTTRQQSPVYNTTDTFNTSRLYIVQVSMIIYRYTCNTPYNKANTNSVANQFYNRRLVDITYIPHLVIRIPELLSRL